MEKLLRGVRDFRRSDPFVVVLIYACASEGLRLYSRSSTMGLIVVLVEGNTDDVENFILFEIL